MNVLIIYSVNVIGDEGVKILSKNLKYITELRKLNLFCIISIL